MRTAFKFYRRCYLSTSNVVDVGVVQLCSAFVVHVYQLVKYCFAAVLTHILTKHDLQEHHKPQVMGFKQSYVLSVFVAYLVVLCVITSSHLTLAWLARKMTLLIKLAKKLCRAAEIPG